MSLSNHKLDAVIKASASSLVDEDVEYANSVDVTNTVVSEKALRKVRKRIKTKEHNWWSTLPIAMRRSVAAVLCICTVAFFTCMAVAPVRAEFFKIFINGYEKFAAIFYVSDNSTPDTIEDYNEPTLQPSDTIKQTVMKDSNYYIIQYIKGDEVVLVYQQSVITDSSSDVDNENCTMSDVEINENKAVLFTYNDGHSALTWHDDKYAYSIYSYSTDIQTDMLTLIAESIK